MKYFEILACILMQAILVTIAQPTESNSFGFRNVNRQPSVEIDRSIRPPSVPVQSASNNFQFTVNPPRTYPEDDYVQPQSSSINNNYIQAPCQTVTDANGDITFNCKVRNPADLTWKHENILWISPESQRPQKYTIAIDNYKLEELIKAGFKAPVDTSSQFNILVKRPTHSFEASVDSLKSVASKPTINLQYEPVKDLLVHYPVNKEYRPLQGPIYEPNNDGRGNISPRFNRNIVHQNSNNQQFQNPSQFRPFVQTGFQPQIPNRSY